MMKKVRYYFLLAAIIGIAISFFSDIGQRVSTDELDEKIIYESNKKDDVVERDNIIEIKDIEFTDNFIDNNRIRKQYENYKIFQIEGIGDSGNNPHFRLAKQRPN